MTFAGSGVAGCVDDDGVKATFNQPRGIEIDQKDGSVYVCEFANHNIRKITPEGTVTTFAGTGTAGLQDGNAKNAMFNNPMSLAIHPVTGDIYVVDNGNERIRKITKGGIVSTFAGKGSNCGADVFSSILAMNIDAKDDSFLVADYGANKIRKITQKGVVSTIEFPDGGGAMSSNFVGPISLTIDQANRVCYVCENQGRCVKKFFLE